MTERTYGISIQCDRAGSRSQCPDKYERDARVLEKALATETDELMISRYTFYLAQTYRDCGDLRAALAQYERRANLGFWVEERFYSLYQAARLQALLGYAAEETIACFLRAYELCPTRAEPLHGAMEVCRRAGNFNLEYLLGQVAVRMERPSTSLFLENWIYDYGLFDEFSVLAYWSGHYAECREYAQRILMEGRVPTEERMRISANIECADRALLSAAAA